MINTLESRLSMIAVVVSTALLSAQSRAVLRTGADPLRIPYWHTAGEGWGEPATDNAFVYFLSRSHEVIAFDATTGARRWLRNTGESGDTTLGTTVLVSGSTVVAADYNLYGLDAGTGTIRWKFEPTDGYGPGYYLGDTQNDLVFAGSPSGRVYAVRASTGTREWTNVVSNDGRTTVVRPAVRGGLVAAPYSQTQTGAPQTGGVVAIDATTGQTLWRTLFPASVNQFAGTNSAGNVAITDDLVIATSADGTVHLLNSSDGSNRGTFPPLSELTSQGGLDYRIVAAVDRTLLVGSLTGIVVAYNLDSKRELWRRIPPSPQAVNAIQIVSGSAYVSHLAGRLLALRLSDGLERWRSGDSGGSFTWKVGVSGNRLFVASFTSGFWALRP